VQKNTLILKVVVILPKYSSSSFGSVQFIGLLYTKTPRKFKKSFETTFASSALMNQYFPFIVLCAIALPNKKCI